VYEQIGRAREARLAPPKEEMVAVHGRMMHVVCMGQGPTTFVLDAGLGGWSVFWWRIQPVLAKVGRACAFDRAGEGWSDASDGAHDGWAVADQLAELVAAAHIPTPFIYVGHSLGAVFAPIYYARYPSHVAGLVLLDPGDPRDLLEDFHGTRAEAMSAPDCSSSGTLARTAGYLGITRLVAANAPGKSFPGDTKAQYRAGLARSSHWVATAAYFAALPKTAYQAMDVQSLGDTPALILASSELRRPEGKETVEDVKAWRTTYRAYLASLAARSSKGIGPIEVPDSSHVSMVLGEQQAAMVANSIVEFAARAQAAPCHAKTQARSTP